MATAHAGLTLAYGQGISTGEVLAHELHVFARLEFGVFLPPREVLPHFRRILKVREEGGACHPAAAPPPPPQPTWFRPQMLRMSDLDYLGTGFYVYEEEKEEYRLAGVRLPSAASQRRSPGRRRGDFCTLC